MYKTELYSLVKGGITHSKPTIWKRWYYAAVHRLSVDVLPSNITFFLRFYTLVLLLPFYWRFSSLSTRFLTLQNLHPEISAGPSWLASQASTAVIPKYRVVSEITHSPDMRVFKCRRSKSIEKAKIRPLATPIPLNQSSKKLDGTIISRMNPGMQNFEAIGLGVSAPQISICFAFAVITFFVFAFFGEGEGLQ